MVAYLEKLEFYFSVFLKKVIYLNCFGEYNEAFFHHLICDQFYKCSMSHSENKVN